MDGIIRWSFVLLLQLLIISVARADAPAEPVWKEHPYLFVEKSDVPAILERARKHKWAGGTLDRIRTEADKWVDRRPEFPPSTGRHDVVYVCPICKVSLNTLSPTQHQCPKCKKIYSGLPYDAVLYKSLNKQLSSAAANLGLASLLFNDPKYARKALDILLGYAERYGSYPLLDTKGNPGKTGAHVFDQTLGEAVWIINMAWAYDLVLGAGVGTEEEHQKVENDLLRASVETIKRNNAGKSNWQAWHNAGMMAVGLAIKDPEIVQYALHNTPGGFYYQMKNSVTSDGAWFEGSWSYHYYTATALLKTAEAAYRSEIDLYRVPQTKAIFEAPFNCLMPDGKFPATHDGESSAPPTALYELPAARYRDAAFQNVLAEGRRDGLDALLSGIDDPKETANVQKSLIMPGAGAAVLRRGGQYLWMDYGPHGGGHGHLDKLSVDYFTAGENFAPDLGRGWPYNLPIHLEWYRRSLSHNTVTVDGMDQKECEGKLESCDFGKDFDIVTASADKCYEGVQLKRTVVMGSDWMLDIFDASSDAEHTYDWAWYTRADMTSKLGSEASELTGKSPSYKYPRNIRKADSSKDFKASWNAKNGTVYGLFRGAEGRQVFLCDAPDKPSTDTLRGMILREKGKSARFIALFSLKPMEWTDLPETIRERVEQK